MKYCQNELAPEYLQNGLALEWARNLILGLIYLYFICTRNVLTTFRMDRLTLQVNASGECLYDKIQVP